MLVEDIPRELERLLVDDSAGDPRLGAASAEVVLRFEHAGRPNEVLLTHVGERSVAIVRDVAPRSCDNLAGDPLGLDQVVPVRTGDEPLSNLLPETIAVDLELRTEIPFFSTQKGIYRAAAQAGPAALAVQTSWKSPYGDTATDAGFVYAYRSGSVEQADNRALRAAHRLQAPIVHYVATRPNFYKPIYPCFIVEDDPVAQRVLIAPGKMGGHFDEREPLPILDPIERKYVFRQTKVRVHQARFRGQVVPAYGELCAICRLKEGRLLDAAHIVGDAEEQGEPVISNGLSLCSIHHRAFDHDLVGITPDYEVRVARRLLDDEDGPMLELLKGFHKEQIKVPSKSAWRPDKERLAVRFERFAKVD